MRSVAMLNQKGGVGKTTTAVGLSAGLALEGQRVLLLDLDPQSHATLHLGIDPADDRPGVYDLLLGRVAAIDTLRPTVENLSVIPASIDLVAADIELAQLADRDLVLRNALEPVRDRFDYLIIDCPPSLGTLTINALAAVEEVVIPLQPHFLALHGLSRLLETVTLVRGVLNESLRITGVVLCMNDKGTRLAQEVAGDVRTYLDSAHAEDPWYGARVFDTAIRRNVKLAECPSFGQTIFDYAPNSHGADDYLSLTREFLGMGTAPHSGEPDSVIQAAVLDEADVVSSAAAAPIDNPPVAEVIRKDEFAAPPTPTPDCSAG